MERVSLLFVLNTLVGFESAEWVVPITVATSKSDNALTFVLDKRTTSVVVENVCPEDWVLVSV